MLLDAVSTHRMVTHDADGTVNVAQVYFQRPAPDQRHLHVVR